MLPNRSPELAYAARDTHAYRRVPSSAGSGRVRGTAGARGQSGSFARKRRRPLGAGLCPGRGRGRGRASRACLRALLPGPKPAVFGR